MNLLEHPMIRERLRRIRRAPERWLHSRRRSAAIRRIRGLAPLRGVLFVCHGNIYRSPYAARLFESLLPDALRRTTRTLSGGFVGPNRPSPPEAVALARSRGVDLDAHRSRLLDAELLDAVDLVVVVDAAQAREIRRRFRGFGGEILILGDLDPLPIETRAIVDPWQRGLEALRESYARIERCIRSLVVDALRVERAGPDPPAPAAAKGAT